MKRSIFVKEHLEKNLAKSGLIQVDDENFSGAVNEALDRYFEICSRSRPVLSIGEWEAIKAAIEWEREDDAHRISTPFLDSPRRLPLIFEDYMIDLGSGRHTTNLGLPAVEQSFYALKKKYPFSGVALLEKLQAMTYPQLVSAIQAVESEVNLKKEANGELGRRLKAGEFFTDDSEHTFNELAYEASLAEANRPRWPEAIGWEHCAVNLYKENQEPTTESN
jgi:hypothetical protein